MVKRLTQLFAEQPFAGSNPARASKKSKNFWDRADIQGFDSLPRLKISAPENMIDKEKVREFSTNALIKVIEIGPPALAVISAGIGIAGVIFNEPVAQRLGAGLFGEGTVLSGTVILGKRYHEKPRDILRKESPPAKP
jgi:hypothetical protein